ncbi:MULTISPECIES: hypothetical protein [unclassified Ruegeria]|uniref:hypothetical protein n=1 Tax=unclassified Ruegeria TaxID=2625375 RepID=UPI001ADADEE8|nr:MULTISPECIES: hypothetical protein [unclassified Ruegeria]MBO9410987.1 hypothetical protein [Ruegeria sp. R8_1]MBO9415188.1 hypothetical protein [Ruegeria sp. R8_2]
MNRLPETSDRPVFLLPWRFVSLLLAMLCLVVGATTVFTGPSNIPGAISGLILGFFGIVFGGRVKTTFAILSVAVASAITVAIPAWLSFYVLAPAFAVLAGTELARFGTRVTIFAIMSWIILSSPVTLDAELLPLLLVFSVSAAVGVTMAILPSLEGRVEPSDIESGYAITHGIALAVGLVCAQLIASQFENAHSHWVALLFTARALDPPGSHVAQARRKGLAMVLGAGMASVFVTFPLTTLYFKLVAVVLILIGLRYLPSRKPISPASMSAGIVLMSSPTTETALFRAEAALLACGLVLLVFFGARTVRRAILEKQEPEVRD